MQQYSNQEVMDLATQCALAYRNTSTQEQPSRVIDMATTGEIPAGYTHLVFVAFDRTGYVVSRNLEGHYQVQIADQITC